MVKRGRKLLGDERKKKKKGKIDKKQAGPGPKEESFVSIWEGR